MDSMGSGLTNRLGYISPGLIKALGFQSCSGLINQILRYVWDSKIERGGTLA